MGSKDIEKKRKHSSDKKADKPSKKLASQRAVEPLRVEYVQNAKGPVPVIASTPGVDLPDSVHLNAYSQQRSSKKPSSLSNSELRSAELLVHSATHPRIDFVGRETQTGVDALRNHYAAVYDPQNATLQIIEARNMVVTGSMRERAKATAESDEEESEAEPATIREQRNALTETFGTKQAIRSARSLAENALLSNARGAPNAVENALLSTMPNDAATKAQQKQAEIQAAKPLPTANLAATSPADVYTIESLVPNGSATLRHMPISEWEEAVENGMAVTTTSRFVAHRVEDCVNYGDETTLQVLRFILVLIEFAKCLKSARGDNKAGPGSKRLPPREDLRKVLTAGTGDESNKGNSYVPDAVLDAIRRRFVPQGSFLTRTDITLLHTTICALSLHIPPTAKGFPNPSELSTDPADLRDDLRLDAQVVQQYFRELGCRVEKPRETEYPIWGVKTKAEGNARRIARLRIPVEFPKLSRGGRR
ncbi:DNA-directed RNA polymerase I subunit rpa49 [Ascosphaera atra]|nr:DNA-directed RNA polymerase I subunit rpa49 [Ascosphaera atra]